MIKTFKFYKEEDNRWYIDLPEWEGAKADLEMVLGADLLLDNLSFEGIFAYVKFGDEPFEGCNTLTHRQADKEATPGWYDNDLWMGPSTIWLCEVTKFVFGCYPDKIYYK
jgi:hypothetical protein